MSLHENPVPTRNACKLCTPFGACLAYKGIKGAIPFLHGSQGCGTYIRRYMISHFREPIDIASSNFTEDTAIFGGEQNFEVGVANVIRQYSPELVGIASTCLSETIGDDVPRMAREFRAKYPDSPPLVSVSTASYSGTHAEGFQKALRAIAERLAEGGTAHDGINIVPGMFSPADLRHLKELTSAFGLDATLLTDYSETLDGPAWDEYRNLPEGGTSVEDLCRTGSARATVHFASTVADDISAGSYLEKRFGVECATLGIPVGMRLTDAFINELSRVSGVEIPESITADRGRLVDSYVDAHKYLFGKRAVVFGDEDLVASIVTFLAETGIKPVLAVSGGTSGKLEAAINSMAPELKDIEILGNSDFEDLAERVRVLKPDLLVGNSKGYMVSREIDVPLVRVGFPIHDRFGGARILHVGYRGTQALFDNIVNAIIESRQSRDPWGYTYM